MLNVITHPLLVKCVNHEDVAHSTNGAVTADVAAALCH